jgi:demethylmenaquinone methyltransferase / 2-methoxy-6-polyprenyl-1,4-benzoquinol methylase
MAHKAPDYTYFGTRRVPYQQKDELVGDVFHSVADHYDLMNDFMSFFLHRIWKKVAIAFSHIAAQDDVLDVASGTCDLAFHIYPKLKGGSLTLVDINDAMLSIGRDKMLDHGYHCDIHYVLANAEALPFKNHAYDIATIAFGLRNVTNQLAALRSFHSVLRRTGKLVILEFSQVQSQHLAYLYDLYSFHFIPRLGRLVTKDQASYQYLVESIRKHPNQSVLKEMMQQAGFVQCQVINFLGGIVSAHIGYKG